MGPTAEAQAVRREVLRLCHAGHDSQTLRREVLRRIGRVVPWDAWCWPTADPATLLVTGSAGEGIPPGRSQRFFEIEYQVEDFNKFNELARQDFPAGVLSEATGGELAKSARYREIFGPLGIGEDLRVALRTAGVCWGYLVLHRHPAQPFTRAEAAYLLRLGEHLAEGLRASLVFASISVEDVHGGPGVVLLDEDLSIRAVTEPAQRWLEGAMDKQSTSTRRLPDAVYAVVSRLRALEREGGDVADVVPRARVPSRSGRWFTVNASRLSGDGSSNQIAVIVEPASPSVMHPLVLQAYGLTEREREIAALALRGLATKEIGLQLGISNLTVQEHLKHIFDKVGIRSRRELVASVFSEQYWPRIAAGSSPGADGWFAERAQPKAVRA